MPLTRRRFIATASSTLALGTVTGGLAAAGGEPVAPQTGIPEVFPTQAPELAHEVVLVAHFNLKRLKELVTPQPSLARATYDWGFGDWESALGAASHMGNREIAEFLLSQGARPDVFTAAMLGQLEVVKSWVAARPGVQRIKGPHGITLLAHARAGGEGSLPVLRYLEALGDADPVVATQPLTVTERAALLGTYRFGSGTRDTLTVEISKDLLTLKRADGMARPLAHLGSRVFSPAGADTVRIAFSGESPAATVSVQDPGPILLARRTAL